MADVMEKKIATELIKLELLNNNNKHDEEALNYFKKNLDDFPWKDYGDYQNLIAVLAVSEKLETPSGSLLNRVLTDAQKIKKASVVKETQVIPEQDSLKLNIYANSEANKVSETVIPANGKSQTLSKQEIFTPFTNQEIKPSAVQEEKKEVILNKQNISDIKLPPQVNKISQPESNKTIKPLDHKTVFAGTIPEIKPSISHEIKKQDIVNKQNITDNKPFEVKREVLPDNGRILQPLDHKTVFADKKSELKPLQTDGITKDIIVNKYVVENKSIPEIKPETKPESLRTIIPQENKAAVPDNSPVLNPLQTESTSKENIVDKNVVENKSTPLIKQEIKPHIQKEAVQETQTVKENKKIPDNTRLVNDAKPGSDKMNAVDKEGTIKPIINKTIEKLKDDSFTPVKSVSINIEEELRKIEQEVLKDIENIKVQFSNDVQNKTEHIQQNKKENITLKEPDFENVRTVLKEHSKISTKERKPLRETSSSMQSQFKRANWEESITVEENPVPVEIPEIEKSQEALVTSTSETVEESIDVSEPESSVSSSHEKVYPHRKEKRGLVLVIGILIIAIPTLLFFIFSGSSESDKSVNVASTQLPAVKINLEQKQEQEVISESLIEDNQIEKTAQLENTQKTDTKTEIKTETKAETKLIIPPLPESPKIIESAELNGLEENETNDNKTTSQSTVKDISLAPIGQMKKPAEEIQYFVAVEEMPEPIGGIAAIQRKVVYPAIASAAAVEGRVIINAFVDEYGNVTNTEVVKGIGYGCDEAAIDAIKSTKFKPGKQRGKPVNVRITIPILFKRM